MHIEIEIPKQMAHLKKDPRGYPIPYFVPIIKGTPDFKLIDAAKQRICITKRICPICGYKLFKDYSYVITGPVGYINGVVTDPPMHQDCARYSLKACPHLYFENTQRIAGYENPVFTPAEQAFMKKKPDEIRLIQVSKFWPINVTGRSLIKFHPISYEIFIFVNGILFPKS